MCLNHPETFLTPTPVHGKNIFYKTLVPERLEAAAIKKKKKKIARHEKR